MKKRKILVANDDGIGARGIHELVAALSKVAEVYVSAPHMQRSATGHSMTMYSNLFVREVPFEGAVKAYEVSGTPADCVKMGIYLLKEQKIEIDMVFSGINHGSNLGSDTLYSGTVSAAIEGNIKGYPAVALSVASFEPQHFEYAAMLATRFAEKGYGRIGKNTTININVPNKAVSEIKGVKTALLGPKEYLEEYLPQGISEGRNEYKYCGTELDIIGLFSPKPDVMLINEGYATVTPLKADFTDYELMDETEKLMKEIL